MGNTAIQASIAGNEVIFETIFQHASTGILIVKESGYIAMANPFAEKLFGYEPCELTGRQIEVLIPDLLREVHGQHVTNYFVNPSINHGDTMVEFDALHQNGSIFPAEITLAPYEQKGKINAIVYITDITARKQTELRLQADEQRTRLLIENTPAAVAMFDEHMRYIIVSKRWIEDYNLGKRNVTGLSHYEVFPEIPERWRALHKRALRGEVFSCMEDSFPRADGSLDWIKWELCPWHTAQGSIGGVILFTEVITKRKNVEKTLQRLNENLESEVHAKTKELVKAIELERKLNEMKSTFVSMASHEFRTPLATILSSAALIAQYAEADQQEKRIKHTKRIETAVNNLNAILNDFLSIDKLDQGKVNMVEEKIDVPAFINEVIEDQLGHAKAERIKYRHNSDTTIMADKAMLLSVILNLLSNALKYSDGEVELGTNIQNGQAIFTVADKGIGIPEEEQGKLFERFFRAKNADYIQGTGLGLTIVKRCLDLMGGTITFTSKINEGSVFTVCLPQGQV